MEKVLNYKKTLEDYKKSQYGIAQKKLFDEEDKLAKFNKYKNIVKNEKNQTVIKTNIGNLAMYNNYINDLSRKIKSQEQIVNKTRKDAEEAKEEMITAVKEKKIFEKLKEQEYEEYLYQLKRDEEKQTDAIVSYKTSTQQ
ncbi:MAG: flagellar export protein FliJ [Tissierellia bacterium]|nr:flagellar export protein FliJ [Tissierellia bacterium]